MFTGILGIGNTETKLEVKCLQQSVFEKVLLDHTKIVYRLIADCKLHPEMMLVSIG